jgi:hypothetical protein
LFYNVCVSDAPVVAQIRHKNGKKQPFAIAKIATSGSPVACQTWQMLQNQFVATATTALV